MLVLIGMHILKNTIVYIHNIHKYVNTYIHIYIRIAKYTH